MRFASLALAVAALAAFPIATADVASAAKAKFERTKPHVNIGTISRPSSAPAPQVAPTGSNQPPAGPRLTPENLGRPSAGATLSDPAPSRRGR